MHADKPIWARGNHAGQGDLREGLADFKRLDCDRAARRATRQNGRSRPRLNSGLQFTGKRPRTIGFSHLLDAG